MLPVTNYYRNANQSNEDSPHTGQNVSLKNLQITSAGEMVKKRNPLTLLLGMYIAADTVENIMEVP